MSVVGLQYHETHDTRQLGNPTRVSQVIASLALNDSILGRSSVPVQSRQQQQQQQHSLPSAGFSVEQRRLEWLQLIATGDTGRHATLDKQVEHPKTSCPNRDYDPCIRLVPFCHDQELENAYCKALRESRFLDVAVARQLKKKETQIHAGRPKRMSRSFTEERTETANTTGTGVDTQRVSKRLERQRTLTLDAFHPSVKDLHLSVHILEMPELQFILQLSQSGIIKKQLEEIQRIRAAVKQLRAKDLLFKVLEFVMVFSSFPLVDDDVNVLAARWYNAVLDDDYASYATSPSQHITPSFAKNCPNAYSLLRELGGGGWVDSASIFETANRGIELVHQLTFFDHALLLARLDDVGEALLVHNNGVPVSPSDSDLPTDDVDDRNHSQHHSDAVRWFGTLEDFLLPTRELSDHVEGQVQHRVGINTQALEEQRLEYQKRHAAESLQWLYQLCENELSKTSELEPLELMAEIIDLCQGREIVNDVDQQTALLDLLGLAHIDRVPEIAAKQSEVKSEFTRRAEQVTAKDFIRSVEEKQKGQKEVPQFGKQIVVKSEEAMERTKRERKKLRKAKLKGALSPGDLEAPVGTIDILERIGLDMCKEASDPSSLRANQDQSKTPLLELLSGKSRFGHRGESAFEGMGLKRTLPEGTKHTVTEEGVETFSLPARPRRQFNDDDLLSITALPEWAQLAFPGVKSFNPVQSKVFNSAFEKPDNILVSAPTGSGKTNIALLTILQQIKEHSRSGGRGIQSAKTFKIVYIAPMKSLVAEIADKYAKALGPLGVVVQELTADMQLTRNQIEAVHLIVTVPEKWDILTRSSIGSGIDSDASLLSALSCLIIDEVHILNDTRGPIIEAIVARTLRYVEGSQTPVRIVGLSATLPNWIDISFFLCVAPENVFHFDDSYRPIPLQQTFVGIEVNDPAKRAAQYNTVCYEHLEAAVKAGHQVMVFVHARGETKAAADAFLAIAREKKQQALFDVKQHHTARYNKFEPLVRKSRDQHVKRLFQFCIGVHHAGMMRSDRSLVEQMFLEGVLKVLCCTATLAWGVNLPARHVIIKGTNIFDSQAGGFRDVDVLDVLQIFGRAGRPQFDDQGQATLITARNKLQMYLQRLTNQIPVESQFLSNIANAMNAEICRGSVANESEGLVWLGFTYFFVRLKRAPQSYGVSMDQLTVDSELTETRRQIISKTAELLEEARLIRINRTDYSYNATAWGRIAAKFYVDWETVRDFRLRLSTDIDDDHLLQFFGRAKEFEGLKVRNEELNELSNLNRIQSGCYLPPIGGPENIEGKVCILLQAYLSRSFIDSSSLISDAHYVHQNAPRLMRALFEISLAHSAVGGQGAFLAERMLEWCKMLERRLWDRQHVLRHFCYPDVFNDRRGANADQEHGRRDRDSGCPVKESSVRVFEDKRLDYDRLMEMNVTELLSVLRTPNEAKQVYTHLRRIPNLKLKLRVQPITSTIMRIILTITADFEWSDRYHKHSEQFIIWVENPDTQIILHSEGFQLSKKNRFEPQTVTFTIPLSVGEEIPAQYIVKVISERWVGVSFQHEFSVKHLLLPDRIQSHTPLLDLHPLPVQALHNQSFEALYKFMHFNPIQTQVFHTIYHGTFNVLLGAPTGSGKTIVAELAILALFRDHAEQKVIYIAPLKSLARERINDWKDRFGRQLHKTVVELTGDVTPDILALMAADIVVTTPEKWDGVSRHWKRRGYVREVGLIIIDEIHLLGLDRGPILEVIVSRMRYISTQTDRPIRFVGLSTALANAHDIADWLGIGRAGLFNFKPSVRPVPCVTHIQGFPEKHYCPRMATMNKPAFQAIKAYSPNRPVLIFVSSRRQTRLTALDLIGLCATDDNPKQFLQASNTENLHRLVKKVTDETLQRTLEFGVGMHHAGLKEKDRTICEELFLSGTIQVLITTSTLAWGVNFPAHLVIIKGTEYFDGKLRKYVDMPITDVLQMMGRAGRPQFDTSAVACIFVHEPKKDFYKTFLYEPFPVESCLAEHLNDHLNAEIAGGTIQSREEALDYITWTYLFRRLMANPSYYHASVATGGEDDEFPDFSFSGKRSEAPDSDIVRRQRELISDFVENLIDTTIRQLVDHECIEVAEPASISELFSQEDLTTLQHQQQNQEPLEILQYQLKLKRHLIVSLHCTRLGRIASSYYIQTATVALFHQKLSRQPKCGLVDVMKLLCDCPEYSELPVRHNEDAINSAFSDRCPFAIDTSKADSPHVKTFLLLQSHIFNIPLPITDYVTDLKSVLDQSLRIVQAMADVSFQLGQLATTSHICLLLQCITQGAHPYRSALYMLPYFDGAVMEQWDRAIPTFTTESPSSVASLSQLVEASPTEQQSMLHRLFPLSSSAASSVLHVLRGLPKLRITMELQTRIRGVWKTIEPTSPQEWRVEAQTELKLNIGLSYLNKSDRFGYSPKFPKKKTFSWWCLLGDIETDELIGLKRVGGVDLIASRPQSKTSMTFTSPPAPATPASFCNSMIETPSRILRTTTTLSLIVLSDCYIGLDQQVNLHLSSFL